MNGIVAWFARNAVAANLLMVVAFIGGVFSYNQMEREMFPTLPFNGATVSVVWQGASPQDVEEQIVTRIEEEVNDLPGLKRMTSTAREGVGYVNLEARDDVDIQEFINDVKLRIDRINNLPQASFPAAVSPWEGRNRYIGLTVHGDVDPRTLRRVADTVRDKIAELPGGQLAELQAVLDEEVSIEVSEDSLRRFNLSFSDVANAIRVSSLNSSGGSIRSETGNVSVATRNLADTAEQFSSIIIRQSTEQGTIRVGDVATVIDGFVDADLKATYNDNPTAFIMVPQPDDMDIGRYADAINKFVEEANDPTNQIIPEAVKIDILWDDNIIFEARMNLITSAALTGAMLVLLVLVLFLRPTVALWVTVGIITAFAGGIMLLPYLGVSWNVLSTFAVLLVIGVIVDDAIVVGENIHREVESGRREGLDAAIVGTQLVLKPVIFGVLTTIIVFLPWAFFTGPTRLMTQQITFVVVAALTFSIIECMFILPAHLAHLKKQSFEGISGGFMRIQRRIADSLLWFANNVYKPALEWALKFRYATIVFFGCLFWFAVQMQSNGIVRSSFFPQIEGGLVQASIDMPDGTPFSRTLQVRDQLQNAVDLVAEETKKEYPEFEGGMIQGASVVATSSRVQAWIGLVEPEDRPETVRTKDISDRIRKAMGEVQDAEEVSFEFTINDNDTGVAFALSHPDLDRLREASSAVQAQLATYGSVYDIGDSLTSAAEEIRISLKPGAQSLGITLLDVSRQVRQAYFGEEVDRLARDGEDVRVMVRLPLEARESLDSLDNLRVRTADGREIPITQVADFSYAPGINTIRRRDRVRSVTVFAEVAPGSGGPKAIRDDMNANFWPDFEKRFPNVTRGNSGGFEDMQTFNQEASRFGLIAVLGMYILLAVAFRSYAQPLMLMTALPFAYCGAVFGLYAFGSELAMFSYFGMAAAAGVVINDNLVLVDYINRRREEGAGAIQAIIDGGVSRFRPILLTSVTTFVGILPLIAERSVQAQFLKPMVVALGCAVAFAVFVSLFLVPSLYAMGAEVGRIFRWTWGGLPFRPLGDRYSGEVTVDEDELIGTSGGQGPASGDNLPGGLQPAE